MEKTPELVYTDLLQQLARPLGVEPDALADMFSDVEQMHAAGRIEDWQMQNAREAYARTTGSRIGDAANYAVDKARAVLRSGAERVGDRATTAVIHHTQQDPVRAMLIAAATGALLMGLAAMLARSGVRKVRRSLRE